MSRIRTVKPEFYKDEDLSALPPETHMLAAALLNYADDEGYFNANPLLVKAECCPLREDSTNIRRSLDELSTIGYLRLAEGSDGKNYGWIVNFKKHQRVDRPKSSAIKDLATFDEHSTNIRRSIAVGREGNGREWKGSYCPELSLRENSEPEKKPEQIAETSFMSFPVTTKPGEWTLLQAKVDEYLETFPGLDIPTALRRAKQWLIDNPRRRKTARGMPKFIFGWLEREQNRRGGIGPNALTVSAGPEAPEWNVGEDDGGLGPTSNHKK